MTKIPHIGQFQTSRITLSLALGDQVVIILLISIGLLTHDTNPLTSPLDTIITALPYLLGWIIGSLFTGLYRSPLFQSLTHDLILAGSTWIIASLLGAGLRATPLFTGDAPLVFILVMTGLGLITITAWRLVLHTLT